MNFLEARRVLAEFGGGRPLPLLLALSGTGDPFAMYLRAAGALAGRDVQPRFLPFNTLAQALYGEPPGDASEVFLVLPWDLVPEADWRSGVPASPPDEAVLRDRAAAAAARLAARGAPVLYLPAPLPPVWARPNQVAALAAWLESLMHGLGAELLPAAAFALGSYLGSGCPVGGAMLGEVATRAVAAALAARREPAKVIVTDLDNTLWSGVIAEDGADHVAFGPEGRGFRHFVYQTLLARLKAEGALLAAVSRNDLEVVLPPLRSGRMVLKEDDFVAVVASYHAKSAQVRELASRLNLGLDAFVFVDDNPVELAEVELELPQVERMAFPTRDEDLPALLAQLSARFARAEVTDEDRQRTELYRRRLASMAPAELAGADISAFLRDLDMVLTLHDRTGGDRTRAVQLINKTNQFNLNGRRVSDEEVAAVLAAGGRLFGASLADRTGSHGEILACLVDPDGVVRSLVMSCRVFQRRVEHAFFAWLCQRGLAPAAMDYQRTERNEPIRQFLALPGLAGGAPVDGLVPFDAGAFARAAAADLALFRVEEPIVA